MSESVEVIYFPTQFTLMICPLISTLSTFIVLVACFISKNYKNPLGPMIIGINIADFLFCVAKVVVWLNPMKTDLFCKILQAISTLGLTASMVWGALFGHALQAVVKAKKADIVRRYLVYYLIFSITVPLAMALSTLTTNYVEYSSTADTCVHTVKVGGYDYLYTIYAGIPVLLSCILSAVWYVIAAQEIRKTWDQSSTLDLLFLVVYPAILLICWMPNVVVNICIALGASVSPTVVTVCQGFCQLQGFFDALVYGKSRNVIQKLRMLVCRKRLLNNDDNGGRESRSVTQQINQEMTRTDTLDTMEDEL